MFFADFLLQHDFIIFHINQTSNFFSIFIHAAKGNDKWDYIHFAHLLIAIEDISNSDLPDGVIIHSAGVRWLASPNVDLYQGAHVWPVALCPGIVRGEPEIKVGFLGLLENFAESNLELLKVFSQAFSISVRILYSH